MIKLKGMTWDHSRGYDPMIATSLRFSEKLNNKVAIEWDKRPLQAFADRPIEEMTDEPITGHNIDGNDTSETIPQPTVKRLSLFDTIEKPSEISKNR